MTLRNKLAARVGNTESHYEIVQVKSAGRIDAATLFRIQQLALLARGGDVDARDALYFSLEQRLHRISTILKPWPNEPSITGIWDRDDVLQECWLVFAELLAGWDQSAPFVPYLLARFPWRLRDRILRGIGKSTNRFGTIRIPVEFLDEYLRANDGDQPESAAMAKRLLAELIRRRMSGDLSLTESEAWLDLIHSKQETVLASPFPGANRSSPAEIRKIG